MPYDPALTAVAVATNDAPTDQVWRHDTTTATATATCDGDVAHIAIAWCRAADDFTTTSALLARILTQVRETCGRHLNTITGLATISPHSLDADAFRLVQQLERFDAQREALLSR